MKDEELVIKLAKSIVDENNSIYKLAAKLRAFSITATDGNGTIDRFITRLNSENEATWKRQFESVGFKNVSVKPFGSKFSYDGGPVAGDLDISEVTKDFFKNSTSRPKIEYIESPTRKNPYEGRQSIPSDPRLSAPSIDTTNELQKFVLDSFKNEQDELIRAGWYGGSLASWLSRLEALPEGNSIKEKLDEEFPYMNNTYLEKHLLDRQLKPEDYVPTKYEIRYFGIVMEPLRNYLFRSDEKFVNVPENRVKASLLEIINSAKSFRKHKQYGTKEMSEFFDEHQRKLVKRQDDIKDAIFFGLKGLFG